VVIDGLLPPNLIKAAAMVAGCISGALEKKNNYVSFQNVVLRIFRSKRKNLFLFQMK